MAASVEDLYRALHQKVGFEVVRADVTDRQLRILGRIPEKGRMPTWLETMQRLLARGHSARWDVDISKQYFLRGEKLLFGWRVILQAEGLASCLPDIVSTVASAPQVSRQLEEAPLHASPNRNVVKRGKGAQPIDRAVVGPMALRTE